MLKYSVIVVLVLLHCARESSPKSVFINKCCGKGAFYIMGRCVTSTTTTNTNTSPGSAVPYKEEWKWVPEQYRDTFLKLNLSEADVSYGVDLSCSGKVQDLLNFSNNEFELHRVDNQMQLEASKYASFHDADVTGERFPDGLARHSQKFPSSSYCIDAASMHDGNMMHMARLCPCSTMPCVKKCCHDGMAFNTISARCEEAAVDDYDWTPELHESLMNTTPTYYRLAGEPDCAVGDRLTVLMFNTTLHLLSDHSIQAKGSDEVFARGTYCGDYSTENNDTLLLLVCMALPTSYSTLFGVCFIIGACALFLAVLVTLLLPEQLKKLHGRLALAHNFMLFIGFVVTGVMHFTGPNYFKDPHSCKALSFMTQFSILAAFFWLNVMCIDISWVFSGLRPPRGNASQRECKKFVYYSLYAWGSTVTISVLTAIVEYSPGTQGSPVRPRFGENGCFFNNRGAMLLFFYGPMSVLLIMNFLLFIFTAAKIIALKRQTAILHSTESATNTKNKQRLVLYVKLFCLMGVTWVFEVISWAVGGPKSMWVFTDVINLLRGVFIFIIFCCKRKVYRQLRGRLLRMCGRHVGKESTMSTSRGDTRSYHTTTTSSVTTKSMGGTPGTTPGGTPGGTPVANKRAMMQRQKTQVSKLSFELDNM